MPINNTEVKLMLKYLGCRTLDIGSEDESEAFLNTNNHHNQLNTNVKPLRVYEYHYLSIKATKT